MSNTGDIAKALRQIVADPESKDADRPQPRGAAARVVSAATPAAPAPTGGGGIASPLTEGAITTREYHPAGWRTTDGLFTFPAIKTINMTDANGNAVQLRFSSPAP